MSRQRFEEKLQIVPDTMIRLNKGQEISRSAIMKISEYFDCTIRDICDGAKTE